MTLTEEMITIEESRELNEHIVHCEKCRVFLYSEGALNVLICYEALKIRQAYDTLVVLCDAENDVTIIGDERSYSIFKSDDVDRESYDILLSRATKWGDE